MTEKFGYGIPHIVAKGTRHEAIGHAAILGRRAPAEKGDEWDFTKAVSHFTNIPPNRRGNSGTDAEHSEVRCR